MADSPNDFVWFCVCLGVRSTNLEELRSLGPHEPTFVALLDQSTTIIDNVYDGDYRQFLADLEAELNETVEESTDIEIFARIKTWLDGRERQFKTNV